MQEVDLTRTRSGQTDTVTQAEMSELWRLAILIPQSGDAGEDHREAIEAQLSVLGARLTLSQVTAEYGADAEVTVFQAAMRASEWLRGMGEKPSVEWKQMLTANTNVTFIRAQWRDLNPPLPWICLDH